MAIGAAAQLAGAELAYALLTDPAALRLWLEDARDAIRNQGSLPQLLPAALADEGYAGEGRSDCFVSLLRLLYQGFGDRDALERAAPELDLLVARWQAQTRQQFWHDPTAADDALPAEFLGNLRLIQALELSAVLQEELDNLRPAER